MKQFLVMLSVLLLVACTAPQAAPQAAPVVPAPTMTEAPATRSSSAGATEQVLMKDFKFMPQSLTIKVGDTVMWTNDDQTSHTVSFEEVESPELFRQDTWSHTFTKAGTYHYVCGIHGSMSGVVIVE